MGDDVLVPLVLVQSVINHIRILRDEMSKDQCMHGLTRRMFCGYYGACER